jgi:hypothetical protein
MLVATCLPFLASTNRTGLLHKRHLQSVVKTAENVCNHNASLLAQQGQNQVVLGLPLVCIAQNCGLRCGAAGSLLYPAGPVNMPSCMRRCSCFSAAVLDA